MTTKHLRVGLIVSIAALAACGGASSTSTSGSDATSSTGSGDMTLNGCTTSDFVDGDTINFGGVSGSPAFGYSPQCLKVKAGTKVTYNGNFTVHPLSPGTDPSDLTAGSADNPITETHTGMTASFTFSKAGTYPFFCEMHYAAGMIGAVLVQ